MGSLTDKHIRTIWLVRQTKAERPSQETFFDEVSRRLKTRRHRRIAIKAGIAALELAIFAGLVYLYFTRI